MRWYGQLAVIAVLGAAGYGGWYAYKSGHLSAVPVLDAYLPAAGAGAPAQGQRPPQGPPPMVEVDTVRTQGDRIWHWWLKTGVAGGGVAGL
jgi:membrane fusion protein (multidrug efflux system)